MWCPEGCYTWNEVLSNLRETTCQVLREVALAQMSVGFEKNSEPNGNAATCLVRSGHANNYIQSDLIISITTLFLMVQLLECYPPIVSNLAGNRLELDEALFAHRDQFECCVFRWPIKTDPQFSHFFHYAAAGRFDSNELFNRFCFIDPETGKLTNKNGSESYLINGLGMTELVASEHCRLIMELNNYFVFWSDFPDDAEYRELFSCIEANDEFTRAIDKVFGLGSTVRYPRSNSARKGRPKHRDEVARAYWALFPEGHVAKGATWKEVAQELSKSIGRTVTVSTIRRGLSERNDQE